MNSCNGGRLDVFLIVKFPYVGWGPRSDLDYFHFAEMTYGNTITEELVDLLQSPMITLRNAEVRKNSSEQRGSAKDEPDLGSKCGIRLIQKVRNRERGDEPVRW